MGKFSRERIEKHLKNLEDNVSVLKEFQKEPLSNFEDKKKCYAVFHAFLLAIENIMDIGGHILVSVFQKSYSEYKEIIPFLKEKKVIPEKFAVQCKGMAEFRNKIVHNYINIDSKLVYKYLQKDIQLFDSFAKYILEFIEKIKE